MAGCQMSVLVVFPLKTILNEDSKVPNWTIGPKSQKMSYMGQRTVQCSAILVLQRQYFETKLSNIWFIENHTDVSYWYGLGEISVTYIFQSVASKSHHNVYLG